MNDQKQLWNNAHQKGEMSHYFSKPADFAEEVIKIIKPHSNILELGCGIGNDSIAFAKAGHKILATDFSDVAISRNLKQFREVSGLTFKVLDINERTSFNNDEFDIVYARLSLHYFTNEETRSIFDEIHRMLKPNGLLCFVCKSISDPLYGKGVKIEKDMFAYKDHVRHFFSEEYAKSLLENSFKIEKMKSGDEKFYGNDSAFVQVIAKAVK